MADERVEDQAEETTGGLAGKPRSKHGVPRVGLEVIDGFARKIWNDARQNAVPPLTIARAMTGDQNSPASGGLYKARLPALRLFGVIETVSGGNLKLSPLGIALAKVADVEGHAAALKAAMRAVPAYLHLLQQFDGGALSTVAAITHFEFEYSKSAADAATATELFAQSTRYAGLIDNAGNVVLGDDGEAAADAEVAHVVSESKSDDEVIEQHEAEFTSPAQEQNPGLPRSSPPLVAAPSLAHIGPANAPPVALNVKLDMSGWNADDVLRVLAALGYEGTASAES